MKIFRILLVVLLAGLASCQTIPVERTNNCTCAWQKMNAWEKIGAPGKGVLA
jgi:hypothetical protein